MSFSHPSTGIYNPATSIGERHEWLPYAMPRLQPLVLGT